MFRSHVLLFRSESNFHYSPRYILLPSSSNLSCLAKRLLAVILVLIEKVLGLADTLRVFRLMLVPLFASFPGSGRV